MVQLNAVLTDARESLRKADAMLADAQKISASTKSATQDLASVARRRWKRAFAVSRPSSTTSTARWPFARDTEVKLP